MSLLTKRGRACYPFSVSNLEFVILVDSGAESLAVYHNRGIKTPLDYKRKILYNLCVNQPLHLLNL